MRPLVVISIAALAATLEACGGGASGVSSPHGASTAFVRFVNVSPDAGVPDPSNSQNEFILFTSSVAQVTVDAVQVSTIAQDSALTSNGATTAGAPSITAYTTIPAATHSIAYVDPSAYTSSGYLQLATTVAPLKAGDYYTIVLAGSFCLGTLKFYQYADTQSTSGRVVMYNAAPDQSQTIQFGTFPVATGTPLKALGTAALGTRMEAAASGDGLGAYAGSDGALQILPSSVASFDTANAIPFNALTTFSLFYRDGIPQNASSVHCTDKSSTPPFLQGAMTN